MDCPVRDKTFAREVLADKITNQKNLLGCRQFVGKGDVKAMGKLGILWAAAVAFDIIQTVPKFGALLRPWWGIFGGVDFRMKNAFFVGVIVKPLRPLIPQGIARAVCGSGNNAFDLRSSFDGMMKMKNRHIIPLPEGRVFTLKVYKRAFPAFLLCYDNINLFYCSTSKTWGSLICFFG